MPIRSPKAKKLTTTSEFTLYEQSLRRNVRDITPAALRKKVSRARGLRDKYRKLAERQEREARGKHPPRGRRPAQGSGQTRDKERLFQETLDRFEARLAELADPAPAAKTSSPRKTSSKKAVAKKGATKKGATKKRAARPARASKPKRARR